ncbi:thioesterase domain-containing protein [Bradyrhizobium sp. BR 1432]|uniref:thioesterase domain-containing protein n=1 Tax=Bradyrhizobium sp. BR 1432 TaxID=3447966 RepID=UPI003EE6A2B2
MAAILQLNANAGSLVQLRTGAADAPLFLFFGGDGNPRGLSALTSRMHNSRALIGIDFCRGDSHGELPSTVEIMADRSCSAIRALQPRGPYHLVGYSFGGLVAIEVARLLQQSNEEIGLVGLIDTRFDQRFWPTHIFLRSQVHVIYRHLAILVGLPLNQIAPTFFHRSRRLLYRLLRRKMPVSRPTSTTTADTMSATEQHCRAVMAEYRPKYYAGKITSFEADNHDAYGCSPAEVWQGMAADIECQSIAGTHVGIVTDSTSLNDLAAALDSTLTACLPPLFP